MTSVKHRTAALLLAGLMAAAAAFAASATVAASDAHAIVIAPTKYSVTGISRVGV